MSGGTLAALPHVGGILMTVAAMLGVGGIGALVKTWLDHLRAKRAATDEVALALVQQLTARVEKLEQELSNQRVHYEQKIEKLQATYEANQQVARHELNNTKMRFRALVMLLKRLPDDTGVLTAILSDIETMEADQARAEAAEKGAKAGARIAAAGEMTA